MALQKHLVIMVKDPRMGRAKTRLARDVGKVRAWRFYRHMLRHVPLSLNKKGPWQTWLAITPDQTGRKRLWDWSGQLIDQGSGDLGARMLRPATKLPFGSYVLIGTDVVGIKPDHIRKAFKLLGRKDVVFGPATDGGFWLVGHKRHPKMINPYQKGVRWSHPETLNDCLKAASSRQVGFVETLSDVDDVQTFMDLAPKCLTAGHRPASQ